MKNEKKELFVTEISLEDFLRLDLNGYQHRKHHFICGKEGEDFIQPEREVTENETGEWVEDSHGGKHWVAFKDCYSKVTWDLVKLGDIVLENIEFSKEQGWKNPICVAIHTDDSEDMFENSYLDKYLTPTGMQTYLLRCDVAHLYSRRNYFYTTDDYFDVDKRETKAIYLIHWC